MDCHFSRKFITDFINIYQSLPCLWQVKAKEYKIRRLRDDAYKQIIAFCKGNGFPEANRDFVVKKIQSLRGVFRKEQKKVLECQRADEEYIPNLWYYHLLMFIKDQDQEPTSDIVWSDTDMQELPSDPLSNMPDSNILLRRRIKTMKKVANMRRETIKPDVSIKNTISSHKTFFSASRDANIGLGFFYFLYG